MEKQQELNPGGTIIYSTVGRCQYGFDVFSVNVEAPLPSPFTELCLTDGISINFNAQFIDDHQNVVFVSERTGSSQLYLSRPGRSPPEKVPSSASSLFHDRPIVRDDHVFFISAHEAPASLYRSWPAVYTNASDGITRRLTPEGVVDYSPALSKSGNYMAVASYGSKPWEGEFHELLTQIVVFPVSAPANRTVLAERGGWPTWSSDDTLYFHCQSEDGWWSIYRVDFPATAPPRRVTPAGVHAFTPAAFMDGNKIAVATRRKDRGLYRHIEIFDVGSGEFHPVTEFLNPEIHHYNPFVSPGSKFVGYHRFRGAGDKKQIIPNLELIASPVKPLTLLRINGNFPAVSPGGDLVAFNPDFEDNGGVKIMKSDGSKRWTLLKGQIAFYNSWCPTDENVIFTSLGGIFQASHVTVHVARVSFDASSLDNSRTDVVDNVDVKMLTKPETGNNSFPACSPDGKLVVFRSGRSGHKNLYVMDAMKGELEGGFIRQLTKGEWIDTMPCWSPDGEWIAFSSNMHDPTNGVTFGIYMVRPDGSDVKRVHVEGSDGVELERINHVCFSPNGEWLVFTANMGGVTVEPVTLPNQFQPYGDLFMAKVDGTRLTRLTCDAYENGTPTWHSGGGAPNLILNENEVDGDELKGQFVEPLWINYDF